MPSNLVIRKENPHISKEISISLLSKHTCGRPGRGPGRPFPGWTRGLRSVLASTGSLCQQPLQRLLGKGASHWKAWSDSERELPQAAAWLCFPPNLKLPGEILRPSGVPPPTDWEAQPLSQGHHGAHLRAGWLRSRSPLG